MMHSFLLLLTLALLCPTATPFPRYASTLSYQLPSNGASMGPRGCTATSSSISSSSVLPEYETPESLKKLRKGLDKEFIEVALPAFVSLAADPLASLVDAMYVGRLGAVEQAGMGIAISAQYSIAKLYNDPLLKTSTSLVAGKSGDELSASVATAILTAMVIGVMQCILFLVASGPIMALMGVSLTSEMRRPAMAYLKWRAVGVPAATILLVTNGIFRGRGDTKTPLYCTTLGNLVNILLDPILIFSCSMGCAGAGAATAISQWVAAVPLLYLLNKSIPINIKGKKSDFFKTAVDSYAKAGSLIMLRTIAKISAYTVTSSAAARLGTVPMAAYSLTFNLGFATSQLCEAVSIAAQALLARDFPFNTPKRRASAAHVIKRALQSGVFVSSALALTTVYNQDSILASMSKSREVQAAAAAIMPVVLFTQLWKSLAYSTGGILLGGLDWFWSSAGMTASSIICILIALLTPLSLWNIWVSLAAFMAAQVVLAAARFMSGTGPWKDLNLLSKDDSTFLRNVNKAEVV